ncbi:hypothetical protein DCC85_02175 [Paenibacillus sp. CAA11]|uniref:hypothetical protein n=1 Tax=Paenibacillus sp. CAA11 TaxID=1532905 RepID=UPI000D33F5B8|nr:hypothetical protein [Paenibacillus sp. CAA11]AWB43154.1 hypothetical protein DCC85_02175 [Paenibacillus sp. CAA11]
MAFILLEREQKPIRLRGRKVIPSTISVLSKDTLVDGEYIGVRSKKKVNLLNHGGTLIAAPELREAYYISNMTPATLGEEASRIDSDEVFVVPEDFQKIKKYTFMKYTIKDVWRDVFNSFWIPCSLFDQHCKLGAGWIKVSTQEIILMDGLLPKQTNQLQIRLSNNSLSDSNYGMIIAGLKEIDF